MIIFILLLFILFLTHCELTLKENPKSNKWVILALHSFAFFMSTMLVIRVFVWTL